jgi:hypothetical protein
MPSATLIDEGGLVAPASPEPVDPFGDYDLHAADIGAEEGAALPDAQPLLVKGLPEACFSGFTARLRHSGEARHFDTEGGWSRSGKAHQKALGASGGGLEDRPVFQYVDGVELRLEHSGAG